MCFKLKNSNIGPITTDEDVIVYKVFRKTKVSAIGNKWKYTGPFQIYFSYEDLNGTYHSYEFTKNKYDGCNDALLGFHSFKDFYDAVWLMDYLSNWRCTGNEYFEIIPCIIPAGTQFLEGYYEGRECYLSETIKLDY